ncbi:hypothetical protein P692DRAFT_20835026, partial [Suillus brevipes Sb2]
MPIGSLTSTATRTYIKGTTLGQCHLYIPSKCLLKAAWIVHVKMHGAHMLGATFVADRCQGVE